jgi:hypothetical protein
VLEDLDERDAPRRVVRQAALRREEAAAEAHARSGCFGVWHTARPSARATTPRPARIKEEDRKETVGGNARDAERSRRRED